MQIMVFPNPLKLSESLGTGSSVLGTLSFVSHFSFLQSTISSVLILGILIHKTDTEAFHYTSLLNVK